MSIGRKIKNGKPWLLQVIVWQTTNNNNNNPQLQIQTQTHTNATRKGPPSNCPTGPPIPNMPNRDGGSLSTTTRLPRNDCNLALTCRINIKLFPSWSFPKCLAKSPTCPAPTSGTNFFTRNGRAKRPISCTSTEPTCCTDSCGIPHSPLRIH